MKWQNKVGLGGLIILGLASSSASASKRRFESGAEEMGYHSARVAMLIAGPWLIVAGLRQRRRESVSAPSTSKPRAAPTAPRTARPQAPIEPPSPEPPRDPSEGPKLLG